MQNKKTNFLFISINYLILVYLIHVLLFIKMLEEKINQFKDYRNFFLFFYIDK